MQQQPSFSLPTQLITSDSWRGSQPFARCLFLSLLARVCQGEHPIDASVSRLARSTGFDRRTIGGALDELLEMRLVRIESRNIFIVSPQWYGLPDQLPEIQQNQPPLEGCTFDVQPCTSDVQPYKVSDSKEDFGKDPEGPQPDPDPSEARIAARLDATPIKSAAHLIHELFDGNQKFQEAKKEYSRRAQAKPSLEKALQELQAAEEESKILCPRPIALELAGYLFDEWTQPTDGSQALPARAGREGALRGVLETSGRERERLCHALVDPIIEAIGRVIPSTTEQTFRLLGKLKVSRVLKLVRQNPALCGNNPTGKQASLEWLASRVKQGPGWILAKILSGAFSRVGSGSTSAA